MRSLRPLLSVAAFTLAPGCIIVIEKDGGEPPIYYDTATPAPGPDSGLVDCTDNELASVLVHVVDETGAPVTPNSVTWIVPGGETQPAECADERCTTWIAGYEVSGDINIDAWIMVDSETPDCWWEGHTTSTVNVPMSADGCHVQTQELTVTMDSSQFSLVCADGEAPDDTGAPTDTGTPGC